MTRKGSTTDTVRFANNNSSDRVAINSLAARNARKRIRPVASSRCKLCEGTIVQRCIASRCTGATKDATGAETPARPSERIFRAGVRSNVVIAPSSTRGATTTVDADECSLGGAFPAAFATRAVGTSVAKIFYEGIRSISIPSHPPPPSSYSPFKAGLKRDEPRCFFGRSVSFSFSVCSFSPVAARDIALIIRGFAQSGAENARIPGRKEGNEAHALRG